MMQKIITGNKKMADVRSCHGLVCNPKKVSNWLMVEMMRLLKENDLDADQIPFSPENLAKLIKLTDDRTINSTVAKEVFEQVFANDVDPEVYVEEHGLRLLRMMVHFAARSKRSCSE